MPLTTIIKSKDPHDLEFRSYIKEFISKYVVFKTESCKKPFSIKEYDLLQPFLLNSPWEAALIGNAFDYLARFLLALNSKESYSKFLENLSAVKGLVLLIDDYNHGLIRFIPKNLKDPNVLLEEFKSSKDFLLSILSKNENLQPLQLEKICEIFCFFAKLEIFYRSGNALETIDTYFENKKYLPELLKLAEIFSVKFLNSRFVKNKKNIIYNPEFGYASALIRADGDLYIDGTLFDFKTSGNLTGKSYDVTQLVGYFLLNEVNRCALDLINKDSKHYDLFKSQLLDIKQIAFYRARFGEIEYCDLSNVPNNVKHEYGRKLLEWTTVNKYEKNYQS